MKTKNRAESKNSNHRTKAAAGFSRILLALATISGFAAPALYASTAMACSISGSMTFTTEYQPVSCSVAQSGVYDVTAYGGDGGGAHYTVGSPYIYGSGAEISADFSLVAGQTFEMVAGSSGYVVSLTHGWGGSGGGGTFFVLDNGGALTPYLVAGGGGGSVYSGTYDSSSNTYSVSSLQSGQGGQVSGNPSLESGDGGQTTTSGGGGGGGYLTNGGNGYGGGVNGSGMGGYSFAGSSPCSVGANQSYCQGQGGGGNFQEVTTSSGYDFYGYTGGGGGYDGGGVASSGAGDGGTNYYDSSLATDVTQAAGTTMTGTPAAGQIDFALVTTSSQQSQATSSAVPEPPVIFIFLLALSGLFLASRRRHVWSSRETA